MLLGSSTILRIRYLTQLLYTVYIGVICAHQYSQTVADNIMLVLVDIRKIAGLRNATYVIIALFRCAKNEPARIAKITISCP